jgi:alpha-tubulin suppressor-like RCC1 family protein
MSIRFRIIPGLLLLLILCCSLATGTEARPVTPQLAAGQGHTVALLADGTVRTWGENVKGQLGNGTTTDRSVPGVVAGLGRVVAVAAGAGHSVALLADGTVRTWGENTYGQLGDGTTTDRLTPVTVSGLGGVIAIAAGDVHTLALLADGTVRAWGYNGHGRLGVSTPTTTNSTPVTVSGLFRVVAIAAGAGHSVALLGDGTVKTWGYNWKGQLGNGTTVNSITPVTVSGLSGATAITAGDNHTVALLANGTAMAWGYNSTGQLGDGTTTDRLTPVAVYGLAGAVAIAAGDRHTVASLANGTVRAWGSNAYHQLGDGTTTNRLTPVTVSELSGVVAIDAGGVGANHEGGYSVALLADGAVRAWGDNGVGQLGDGTLISRATPAAVNGLGAAGVTAIAGGIDHTVALLTDGTIKTWGSNANGQLGDGTTTNRSLPVTVTALGGPATAIAAGYHSVALLASGMVRSWGLNTYGQLGDGTLNDRSTPTSVFSLGQVVALAAGEYHTVALLSNGTVKSWGLNNHGQLGDGTNTNRNTPVTVAGLTGVIAIAAGNNHTVALLADGTVKTWGYNNYGQLGDGTVTERWTPVAVFGQGLPVAAIAAGDDHTVVRVADGAVQAWGHNTSGQLGNGTFSNGTAPLAVNSLGGSAAAVAAGGYHTMARMSDGTVKTWGDNWVGQLGDGTTTNRSTPVAVSGLSLPVAAIAAGYDHTLVRMADGTVKAWGRNISGQMGDATTVDRWTPVTALLPCAMPASITVPAADADGTYTVSWGPSFTTGVSYQLQEATNSAFTAGLRTAYSGTARTTGISGRSQNVTYFYRVRAIKTGYSASPWRTAASGCPVPGSATAGAPASLTVPAADADGAYAVSWGGSSTAGVIYELQEATASNFTTGLRLAYRGSALSTNISGRSQNVTYYYRVRAVKAGLKDSGYRGANSCAVPGTATAGVPASLTVPATDADGVYPVSWGASSTAGAIFELQEATAGNFTTGLRLAYRGPALSANISGRVAGTTYYYRVRAVSGGFKESGYRTTANGCLIGP